MTTNDDTHIGESFFRKEKTILFLIRHESIFPRTRKMGGRVVNAQRKHEIAGVAGEPNAV